MRLLALATLGALFGWVAGCGGPAPDRSRPGQPGDNVDVSHVGTSQKVDSSTAANVPPRADLPPLPTRKLADDDFKESHTSRDPFRSYKDPDVAPPFVRDSFASDYAIDQLTVKGLTSDEALVGDPSGFAWLVKVGDYVGKAEVVRGPVASNALTVNWRVDAIRPNDVILVRENPFDGEDAAPSTRTLALRTPAELAVQLRTRGLGARAPVRAGAPSSARSS